MFGHSDDGATKFKVTAKSQLPGTSTWKRNARSTVGSVSRVVTGKRKEDISGLSTTDNEGTIQKKSTDQSWGAC